MAFPGWGRVDDSFLCAGEGMSPTLRERVDGWGWALEVPVSATCQGYSPLLPAAKGMCIWGAQDGC